MSHPIRPMTEDDAPAAVGVAVAAFDDHDRRHHQPVHELTAEERARAELRHRHLVKHDPDGAFVATDGDRIVGCALALRRGDLWGLSLLVVDPAVQSSGIGRRLLEAALRYGEGCRRAVILSSSDPRAMRAYATSGFRLHPQVRASGRPTTAALPANNRRVRLGGPDDGGLADRVDETARRAGHGPDHELMASLMSMYVVDDVDGRGYAYLRDDGEVYLLAATDDDTATSLLSQCLSQAVELDRPVTIEHLNARQQWAIEIAYRARLTVVPSGPVFWRGDAPPPAYLPSGAFL
jgi:GNAT superfamily N-acetyltransferase